MSFCNTLMGKPGLKAAEILSDADKYFAGNVVLDVEKHGEDFQLRTTVQISVDELSKFERLCYLRQRFPRHRQPVPPRKPVPSELTWTTYKVLSSGDELTKDGLRDKLRQHFPHINIDVRSKAKSESTPKDIWCFTFLASGPRLRPGNYGELMIAEDFLGITPLSEPSLEDQAVDIVAVPGLGTRAELTFQSKLSGDIWLRDYLPKRIENSRVLLYGYNSQVPDSTSAATFTDMTWPLLRDLSDIRTQTGTVNRPIIFIGHSLGGILIKQMVSNLSLTGSRLQDSEREIYRSCKGFIFFGVPNNGLKNDVLKDMAQGQSNLPLINDLLVTDGRVPNYLDQLNANFVHAYNQLGQMTVPPRYPRVIAFYETSLSPIKEYNEAEKKWLPSDKRVLMVEKLSATLRHVDCMSCPIEATHSDMVKFASKDDRGYNSVSKEIQKMVRLIFDKS